MQERTQPELSERQKTIFLSLLGEHIRSARAVGSRQLSRSTGLKLSPATIRNVLADLEEMELVLQPHTSAGRIPTDYGYTCYVDSMMAPSKLTAVEKKMIEKAIDESNARSVSDLLLAITSALSQASMLLAVVVSPRLSESTLQKLDVVRLASSRIMLILTVRSGLVRSIMLEIEAEIPDSDLETLSIILNERLSGHKLSEIRQSITDRLQDISNANASLVRMIIDTADNIFGDGETMDVHIGGTKLVIDQPEFEDRETLRNVFEVIEDRDGVVKLVQQTPHRHDTGVHIGIGTELGIQGLSNCSFISASYRSGYSSGSLGVLGPMRMDYSRLASLVSFAATTLEARMSG